MVWTTPSRKRQARHCPAPSGIIRYGSSLREFYPHRPKLVYIVHPTVMCLVFFVSFIVIPATTRLGIPLDRRRASVGPQHPSGKEEESCHRLPPSPLAPPGLFFSGPLVWESFLWPAGKYSPLKQVSCTIPTTFSLSFRGKEGKEGMIGRKEWQEEKGRTRTCLVCQSVQMSQSTHSFLLLL